VVLGAVDLNVQKEEAGSSGKKKRKRTLTPTIPSFPPLLSSLLNSLHNETSHSTPQLLRAIGKAFSCQATAQGIHYFLPT
jgi:hypothetical protein